MSSRTRDWTRVSHNDRGILTHRTTREVQGRVWQPWITVASQGCCCHPWCLMSHFTGPIWRRGRVKTLSLVCGESSRGLDGLHGTAQLRDEPAWAGPGRDSMIDGAEHHQSQDRGASGLQEESAAQSRCPACTFFTDACAPKTWLGLLATSHPRS